MTPTIKLPFEIEPTWLKVLEEELTKPYILELALFLAKERAQGFQVYPPENLIFNALWKTPFPGVKVVIVGQDPYHGPGQAHGLSFSVPEGVPPPPSLVNIYKELEADLGIPPVTHGNLSSWAKQGVLLLNAALTVRQKEPLSHHGKGWDYLTDAIIKKLVQREDPLVFVLWGKAAQDKCQKALELNRGHHLVLKAPHPSPFSCPQGFFGSRPFSQINQFLIKHGQTPITWQL